jgi:HlyD family secretion protein
LFERGCVAQARLDSDHAAARAADAAVAQARAEQAAARTDAGGAGASARLAQRRVQDMRVTAANAGVIHVVYRRTGEVVAPGAPLAAMVAAGDMRVRFFAPQALLSRLAPGARVTFACDGCPPGLTGRVSFVATEPQFTPPIIYSRDQREKLVFLLEAIPDDPAGIRPGLPADVGLAP